MLGRVGPGGGGDRESTVNNSSSVGPRRKGMIMMMYSSDNSTVPWTPPLSPHPSHRSVLPPPPPPAPVTAPPFGGRGSQFLNVTIDPTWSLPAKLTHSRRLQFTHRHQFSPSQFQFISSWNHRSRGSFGITFGGHKRRSVHRERSHDPIHRLLELLLCLFICTLYWHNFGSTYYTYYRLVGGPTDRRQDPPYVGPPERWMDGNNSARGTPPPAAVQLVS